MSNSNKVDLEEYKKKILLEIEEQKIMEIEKVGISCKAQYISCFGIEQKKLKIELLMIEKNLSNNWKIRLKKRKL